MMKIGKRHTFRLVLFIFINLCFIVEGDKGTSSRQITDTHCKADSLSNQKPLFVGDGYEVLEILPHDSKAFTQGLTFFDNKLYEGTGLYGGKSEIRQISTSNPAQKLHQSRPLNDNLFGEGITYFQDAEGRDCIIQITWREKKGFIYDMNTLEVVKEFHFETGNGEGWGITYSSETKEFIVSDGTNNLYFWDRDTLQEKRRLPVYIDRASVKSSKTIQRVWYINELEYVEHSMCSPMFQNDLSNEKSAIILANVWYQDILLAIHPESGKVLKIYDFKDLYVERDSQADCFNGVSISNEVGVFYVTGKLWPYMFKIRLK